MTRRPLPVFVLSTGFAILAFIAVRPLFAQPEPPPAPPAAEDAARFPQVIVQPLNGPEVRGKLRLAAVTLRTEVGSTTVGLSHVRRITFTTEPEGKDSVQLTDKSSVRGRVTSEAFAVEIQGAEQPLTIKRSEIREIKVVNEAKVSLVSLLLGLLTLTAMEIVLGVDNIIFLAIIAGKLPEAQRPKARKIGLAAALGTRILLLGSLWLLLSLTAPLFTLPDVGFLSDMEAREVSLRDLILLVGGLFLIGKSTHEIHSKVDEAKQERAGQPAHAPGKAVSFAWTIVTIAVIDIVFSLDSVITAVGMVDDVRVMIAAMVLSMLVMLYFAGPIADFVDRHPTIKVLALSFLILIGVMLVAEGLGQHIDKGYIYAAMAFALVVEFINMKLRGPKEEKPDAKKPDPPKPAPPAPKLPPNPPAVPPRPSGT